MTSNLYKVGGNKSFILKNVNFLSKFNLPFCPSKRLGILRSLPVSALCDTQNRRVNQGKPYFIHLTKNLFSDLTNCLIIVLFICML